MKLVLPTLCVALFFMSCQKTVTPENDITPEEDLGAAAVANAANSPLKSHSLTFTSDYPVKPGEVPPFSFTKTQYSDARIRTIRMLSRKNPIHPAFKKEAVELIGTFSYTSNPTSTEVPHVAFLKGTSEVWEYYMTPAGTGAKRSVSKKNVHLKFYLRPEGYCAQVVDMNLFATYGNETRSTILAVMYIDARQLDKIGVYPNGPYDGGVVLYYPYQDQYGNITSFHFPYNENQHYFRATYDYSIPRGSKNYSFIPSQNLVSQEYSLLEVMQWVAQPTHQRKAAGGSFYVNGVLVNQDQVYKNYKFDANGNQTSLTYGDNILQKTTWHVQN